MADGNQGQGAPQGPNNPQPQQMSYGQQPPQAGQTPQNPYGQWQQPQAGQGPQTPYGQAYGQQTPRPTQQGGYAPYQGYPPQGGAPNAPYQGPPYQGGQNIPYQGAPGYAPYAPGYGQPQMAVKKKSKAPRVLLIIAAVIVVLLAADYLIAPLTRKGSNTPQASTTPSPTAPATDPSATGTAAAGTVRYDSCDSYATFVARLEELDGKSDMLKGLTMDNVHQYIAGYIPTGSKNTIDESENLAKDVERWTQQVSDALADMKKGDARTAQDCQAADEVYEAALGELNTAVQDFQMRRSFTFSTWERIDSTEPLYYIFDYVGDPEPFKPHSLADHVYPDAATLDAQEQQIAAYVPSGPGADGTYLQAGSDMLALAGLTLAHRGAYEDPCWDELWGDTTMAMYCSTGDTVITINDQHPNYANRITQSGYLMDVLRHEAGHYMAQARCGTRLPPQGVYIEGMTDSYARLFLGASADNLTDGHGDGMSEYTMTAETDAAATRVHDGQCIANPL